MIASIRNETQALKSQEHLVLLSLRLVTLAILVVLMTMHLRSLRVFRWEQSVTGGLLVTYCVAVLGLVLCAGIDKCGAKAFQVYITSVGTVLLAVNAATIWRQWQRPGDLTRIVAELLDALGVPLRRQVHIKASLSAVAAVTLLADLTITLLTSQY